MTDSSESNNTPITVGSRQLASDDLKDTTIEHKLAEHRILFFKRALYISLGIIVVLVLMLLAVIKTYLCLLEQKTTIPNNFWHIPLMLVFMISTILSVILTLSAKFGSLKDRQNKEDETNSISENIPMLQEFKDLYEKALDTITKLVDTK